MKKTRKILPLSIYDIPGMEQWLEEQANAGLFPAYLGAWATFTPTGIPGTRFRLEPWGKRGTEPTQEQLELYRHGGWEYALAVGKVYFLFYTTDPAADELYSDHQSRGLSLERLDKRVQRTRRIGLVMDALVAMALIWVIFFFKSRFDIQPDSFARLPLLLVQLFQPVLLLYLVAAVLIRRRNRKDLYILRRTCRALQEGVAPPSSSGPSRGIALENLVSLVLVIPLFAAFTFQQFDALNPLKNISLGKFDRPYVSIQDLEKEPVLPWEALFEESPFRNRRDNYADVQFSLLAPAWYSVTQEAYSPRSGERPNVFSADPEQGANRYAPDLDMTYFHLLIPALARPVAEAQMDTYRLVNLSWSYADADYPGLDFVILAAEPDGIWQMAALGKDGRVAVFRYAGTEQLPEHLELLASIVL